MRSKTLSENTKFRTSPALALARNLYSRFFWLPLVYSIFLVVFAATYLPSLLRQMATERLAMPAEQIWPSLVSAVSYQMIFTYFVAIAVAAFFGCTLFSYLNHTASTGFLGALPVRRSKVYVTYWLTGLSLLLIPPVLTSLFMLTVLRAGAAFTFLWLALVALYSTVVFSGAVMVSLLSGNTVGSIAFTVFAILLPAITEGFLDLFLQNSVYGRPDGYLSVVSRCFYLMPQLLIGHGAWIYVVYTALFFLAGLFLFRKRQMENAGNLLAFPRFRAFALYICALIVGMIAYLLFDANNAMFLVFGVLAAVVINFPMRKRFTVKGAILPALAFVVTALGVFAVVHFDLTGYERYLPEAKDVAEVRVCGNGYQTYLYQPTTETSDGVEVTYLPEMEGFKTQGEIENAIALHHYLIEQKGRDAKNEGRTLYIEYILKTGKSKARLYYVSYEQDAEALRTVMESETMRGYTYPFLRPGRIVTEMSLENPLLGEQVKLTREQTNKVAAALRRDILSLSLENDTEIFARRCVPFAYLNYWTRRAEEPREDKTAQRIENRMLPAITESNMIYLYADYKETIALLSSMGCGDYLKLPEKLPKDICADLTRCSGGQYGDRTVYTLPETAYTEETVTVTDPEDVRMLMRLFESASRVIATEEERNGDPRYCVYFRYGNGNGWYADLVGTEPAFEAMLLKYKR